MRKTEGKVNGLITNMAEIRTANFHHFHQNASFVFIFILCFYVLCKCYKKVGYFL